jgi:hypothetical protein
MKFAAVLFTLVILTTPVLAFEIEEIGTIQATFDGESIAQPTVLARDKDQESATAFLMHPGAGFSSFSLAGYSRDNKRLGIEVTYMTEKPGPQTAPVSLTITYSPQGKAAHWTSEEAPTPASISFTTLEADDKVGRAVGGFVAVLCFSENYESGADSGNCRPIEGSFDTKLFVE